ncbi:MAG: hypothetical protein ACRDL7_04410 [Gaiellaceae bacterium]
MARELASELALVPVQEPVPLVFREPEALKVVEHCHLVEHTELRLLQLLNLLPLLANIHKRHQSLLEHLPPLRLELLLHPLAQLERHTIPVLHS